MHELRVVEVAWPRDSSAPSVESGGGAGGPRYRVEVGDLVIAVDDDFQQDTLARLLAVVRAC
jgi:hypothetical protein